MERVGLPAARHGRTGDTVGLVVMTNPFRPCDSRTIYHLPWSPGLTVGDCLMGREPETLRGVGVAVSVNGRTLPEHDSGATVVFPGDFVVLCPYIQGGGGGGGGKDALRIVAQIAVMAAAIATFSIVAGPLAGALGVSTALGQVMGAVAAAGVSVGGSLMVNALLPPPRPDLPALSMGSIGSGFDSSPTYGWGPMSNLADQGVPIPVIYGTHKVAGNVIARHVTTEGSSQYLNLLIALGEGPVDSITDVRINGNPAQNYRDVEIETRPGTLDQSPIPYFHDVVAEQPLSMKVTSDWTAAVQTQGNAVEGLRVDLVFPYGLYYIKTDGRVYNMWTKVQMQYRAVGAGSWTDWGTFQISDASRSPVRRSYRIDDLAAGRYEVRMRVAETANASPTLPSEATVFWGALAEVYYDELAYPGVALLGIRALATDQLSGGQPSVTCVVSRETVSVYNPDTEQWEDKPASNPAWTSYDALANARYGGGADKGRLIYGEFEEWADRNDETANGEPRHTFNGVFDSPMPLWDAMMKIAQTARAMPVMKGTRFGVVVNKEASPVQLFTSGNILQGSFKVGYMPQAERAEEIEVTYFDAGRDYRRTVLSVFDPDWNEEAPPSGFISKKAQITLFGVTSRNQAAKEALFRLNCNRILHRVAEWEADVDALACQVGDVVNLQHDAPMWGEGGRVASGAADSVTLDREVTLQPGLNYRVIVRHEDDSIEERTVLPVEEETTTDTLTVTSPWTAAPQKHEVYAFGEVGNVYRPYRILNISRSQELIRKIVAIEYDEGVFDDDLAPDGQKDESLVKHVSNLLVTEWMERQGNTLKTMVSAAWAAYSDFYGGASVYVSRNGGAETFVGSVGAGRYYFSWEEVDGNSLVIRVVAKDLYGNEADRDTAPTINHNVLGKKALPANVTGFVVHAAGDRLAASWSPVPDPDLDFYEIRHYPETSGGTWGNAQVYMTEVRGTQASLPPAAGQWMIKAVDTGGRYSESAAVAVVSDAVLLQELNVVETLDEAASGWQGAMEDMAKPEGYPQLVAKGIFDEIPDLDAVKSLDCYGGIEEDGYYYFAESVDLGDVYNCRVTVTSRFEMLDYSIDFDGRPGVIDDWPNFDTLEDVDVGAYVEMRTSPDGSEWTSWGKLLVADVQARSFEFRVYAHTASELFGGRVVDAKAVVDMPDRMEAGEDVSLPPEGASVTFAKAFRAVPAVGVTIQGAQSGDYAAVSNKGPSGFDVQVLNGGSGVARTIDWIAKGYGKAA